MAWCCFDAYDDGSDIDADDDCVSGVSCRYNNNSSGVNNANNDGSGLGADDDCAPVLTLI